jgi:nicotinamidase/pyrazinamidase
VVSKATTLKRDAYSAFQGTELDAMLRAAGARRLFVGGLATDYCVLETVKDGLANGFAVCLMRDAIRAVEAEEGDGMRALAEMARLGAESVDSSRIED